MFAPFMNQPFDDPGNHAERERGVDDFAGGVTDMRRDSHHPDRGDEPKRDGERGRQSAHGSPRSRTSRFFADQKIAGGRRPATIKQPPAAPPAWPTDEKAEITELWTPFIAHSLFWRRWR